MKKKTLIIFIILITLINTILPVANAAQIITKANLINDHSIKTHIKQYNAGDFYEVKCNYICYKIGENKYPAYCIAPGIHGVDEEGDYTVTVNDLLNDKLIYNTILNGYPYKTAAQLGVETNDDAYVATKLAIKSLLLDRDIKEHYKAMDEKGEKIIEAMYNIAENGKAGNAVNKEVLLSINKVGDLVEKGDYYYQEYSISADVNISNYTVKRLENFSDNCFITDTNGVKKEEFSNNQNFRVMIPKSDLDKNISGKITVTASCNTKPIFYGEAPNSSIQDYAVTYEPYAEYTASTTLNKNTNTSSIKVVKQDAETSQPIENVSFGLYKENGDYITTQKTDSNGIAIFNNLYQGTYKLKEIESNEEYIKDDTVYEINTEYNKQSTKTITNIHKKGNLKITKVDKDNPDITLGAIEFDLIDENGKIVAHLITDVNGEAEINNINIGTYTLKETNTKREYNLCENEDIVIEWNKTSDIVIENEKKKGQIKIIKEDKDRSEIKLSGVKFQIIDKNDKLVEEIETNDKGEAISSRLPIGEYKIKEIDLGNNTNYLLNDELYTVQVEDKKISEIVVQNEHKKGNLKIIKVDKDNNSIALEGVKLEITDEDGFKHEAVTDEKGIANVEDIRIGNIEIKEIKTNNAYVLSQEIFETVIEYNKTSEITIENEKKKGQVEIYKTDKENKELKISDVEFEILDEENKIVDRLTTNEKGYAISKRLPIGEYYLKEVKTNSKYALNDEIIKIEIKEDKVLKVNVENEKIKGKIQIIKSSSTDSPILNIKKGEFLSDVVFEIFNDKGEIVDTVVTDESGQALSKELEKGRYKVKEKITNKYYILDTNEFFVNIEKDNEIKVINVLNDPIIPQIDIEKTGQQFAEKNEEIKYEFNIENISNSKLDNFTWKEYIPYEQSKVTKMITGIYSENIDYKIFYKTNQNDYRLFKKVNSCTSEYLDFDTLNLSKDEMITEIKVEYKTVSGDFKAVVKPTILVKINNDVKKDDKIINITELSGNVEDYIVKDKSSFETIIKEKEILKKLPKTGC